MSFINSDQRGHGVILCKRWAIDTRGTHKLIDRKTEYAINLYVFWLVTMLLCVVRNVSLKSIRVEKIAMTKKDY